MDTPVRSWVKSITWRILGILLLGGITYLITKSWKEMAVITARADKEAAEKTNAMKTYRKPSTYDCHTRVSQTSSEATPS